MLNLVELCEEGKWDQKCLYGHKINGHAVYCHNDKWPNAPRKCRRSWYTGDMEKDEDCPGYELNPNWKDKDNG